MTSVPCLGAYARVPVCVCERVPGKGYRVVGGAVCVVFASEL